MNKVAIFGATGPAGLGAVKAALEKGLNVQALVRDMSRLPKEYQGKISVVQGNVVNLENVKKTIDGQDAVIVCLGTRNNLDDDAKTTVDIQDQLQRKRNTHKYSTTCFFIMFILSIVQKLMWKEDVHAVLERRKEATTVLSDGMKNIVAAMKEKNVKVVSICLSIYMFEEKNKVPRAYQELNNEHHRMFDAVKDSGLQWIACYAPYFSSDRPTGYVTKHGAAFGSKTVSTYDLGRFFIDSLSMPEHYQKIVGIASK